MASLSLPQTLIAEVEPLPKPHIAPDFVQSLLYSTDASGTHRQAYRALNRWNNTYAPTVKEPRTNQRALVNLEHVKFIEDSSARYKTKQKKITVAKYPNHRVYDSCQYFSKRVRNAKRICPGNSISVIIFLLLGGVHAYITPAVLLSHTRFF